MPPEPMLIYYGARADDDEPAVIQTRASPSLRAFESARLCFNLPPGVTQQHATVHEIRRRMLRRQRLVFR